MLPFQTAFQVDLLKFTSIRFLLLVISLRHRIISLLLSSVIESTSYFFWYANNITVGYLDVSLVFGIQVM